MKCIGYDNGCICRECELKSEQEHYDTQPDYNPNGGWFKCKEKNCSNG